MVWAGSLSTGVSGTALWAAQPDYEAIIAAKVSTGWVWDVINMHMPYYWDWKLYLKDEKCYARTDEVTLTNEQGNPFKVWLHTCRSDFKSGLDTDEFATELADFEQKWADGKASATSPMLRYFKAPADAPGKCRLVQDDEAVQMRLRRCGRS